MTNLFEHLSIASFELEKKNFEWLKKASQTSKKNNLKYNKNLIGHMKEEYEIKDWPKSFELFLMKCTQHDAFKSFLNNFSILSDNKPIYLNNMWVNYQKKHEFNPIHNHNGLFSFIIFIKIPYDLKKEDKYFNLPDKQNNTSRLVFLNSEPDGSILDTNVDVDKSFEGKMFMFLSKQTHMVYPFYTSDGYRITVSGNMRIKV
mgnify:CR=1 FL=1|tara:strand:- start:201 stop:806 length:606 start_codon:yes stop_codon:yes gene_type:complete